MEITKQNETFNLTDVTETFKTNGSVSCDVYGSLSIHFTVTNTDGDYVGDCHYNKQRESDVINYSVDCSENNRDSFTSYTDTVIDSVLEYMATIR